MANKNMSVGEGVYLFNESTGVNNDPINVYYYRPESWKTGDSIVFVFHGMNRNAKSYLKYWKNYADDNNLLIICPEFTNDKYPNSNYYNLGNVMSNGILQSEEEWVFPVANRIIQDVKSSLNSSHSNIFMFGHSAGAQFIHRYALLDETEADLIIAANSGYYTMPDEDILYSYGIKGLNLTNDDLAKYFSKPIVVMLGESDTLRSDDLNQSEAADKQGLTRFSRGNNFYNQSKAKAEALGVPFKWSKFTVPGVGHSANGMSRVAVNEYIANYNGMKTEILPKGISYNSNKTTLYVTSNFTDSSVKAADFTYTLKTIDASADKNFVNIKANYRNNIIKAGNAGGNIYGLGGNDTLYGGAGVDVFYYFSGDGDDIIQNYNSNDKLQIDSTYTKSIVGNDIIIKVSNGSIILKNAKGKSLNINGNIEDDDSNTVNIPQNAFTYNGHSYYIYSEIYNTWKEAESYCESLGGHLAVINNASENITLFSYMKSLGYDSAYFGYSDSEIEGTWKWVNNEKSTYTNWAKNEPNGENSDEDYAEFYYKYTDGKWNDGDFKRGTVNSTRNDTNTFICEWDTLPVENNISTSTTLIVTNSNVSPVTVNASIKNINASTRTSAVKITGNSLSNSIKGGKGADTLIGGKGNDSLTGGNGNDVFVYNSGDGKDVITDYSVGQDKIKITGAKISKTSISGSDVILTVGSGSIKVKNAKGKKLSIYNNSASLTNTVIGSSSPTSTTLNVTNSTKSPVTAASTIKVIDASKRTTAVKITGNSLANTIKGGSAVDTVYGGTGNDSILGNNGNDKLFGDAGADTLSGGKGNDTLTGGNGNDVFVYANNDGNDVITDYTAKQDKIRLTSGSISNSSLKGSDVVIKIGSGSITVKNGKNKSITVVDSNNKSTSKVYGTSSKNYIEKLWFETDDNFINDEITAFTQQNVISNDKLNNATGQLINYDTDNILLNNQQITSSLESVFINVLKE